MLTKITIKKTIRELSRSPIGLFLRGKLNIYPPAINLRYSEVSSDLFIWRDPAGWNNYFNIAHLGPILNPNYQENYNAFIEFYDASGSKLGGKLVILVYGESKLLDINDLSEGLCKLGNNGTFAIFHLADIKAIFNGEKICIAERGFVSYKRKTDKSMLRSYSHGNTNAVAFSLKTHKSRRIGVLQKDKQYFRSQLNLDDSISSEIILVNFLEKNAKIKIFHYKNNKKEQLNEISIASGGLAILKSNDDFNLQYLVEFESKLNFLRPVIFKYYENHFDVLHG